MVLSAIYSSLTVNSLINITCIADNLFTSVDVNATVKVKRT